MYRSIHEIIPVNNLMFKYNICKMYLCVFCYEVETLRHLFFECAFNSQLLWLIKNLIFGVTFKNSMLEEIDISNDKIKCEF